MNFSNPSFVRKVVYLAAIAILLLPIAYLSQPATITRGEGGTSGSAGGKLAKLRVEYNLSQAELGEIDPASETMKLATLGLRGVAVNALWISALHYQKTKDFNNLELTVKQIIRLQPNFLKVWDFQAHNLSYNTSVEFDNYRDRYQWVKKGIDFLILGTQYNRDEPGLLNSIGWFVGQKMGRSDENRQFRRLFKEDKDFHAVFRKHGVEVDDAIVLGKPDSWLVSHLWYLKAEDAVEQGRVMRLKQPLLFYNSAPMALINAANALENDDGIFGQTAQLAWLRADDSWAYYGRMDLLSSGGFYIKLEDAEQVQQRMRDTEAEIDELVPGAREKLLAKKVADLPADEQALFAKPQAERTPEDHMRVTYMIGPKISVSVDEVAAEAARDVRTKARALADRYAQDGEVLHMIASNRNVVNYEYWKARCEAEQLQTALDARRLVREADQIRNSAGELSKAKGMYEEAWKNWAVLFEKYPVLLDSVQGQELVQSIAHYRDLLRQLDVDFPADFPLNSLLEEVPTGRALQEEIRIVEGMAPGSGPEGLPRPILPPPPTLRPAPERPAEKTGEKPAQQPAAKEESVKDKSASDEPAKEEPAKGAPAADSEQGEG
jgi:hypothetical protein